MMDHYAIIFDWQRTTPVYHGFDNDRLNEGIDVGRSRDFTRCGLMVSEYDRDTQRFRQPGDWFPLKHAPKFGKACRKCFAVTP